MASALMQVQAAAAPALKARVDPVASSSQVRSQNARIVLSGFSRREQIRRRMVVRASEVQTAADASGDSVVAEVAALPEADDTDGVQSKKKPSPLERGGTLSGKSAAGKDPSLATLGANRLAITGEKFSDPRWKEGTWDLAQFTKDGKVDWDAVIDAEVVRRQWLEENPQSSSNDDPVLFETSNIPWWAWVRRFHLPEAEKLNGRAAMVGFFMAYVVDGATGVGLVDQMSGFLGKLLLLITVVGVLLVRKNEDVTTLKELVEESTFYDKQWQAAWKEGPPPANSEEKK